MTGRCPDVHGQVLMSPLPRSSLIDRLVAISFGLVA